MAEPAPRRLAPGSYGYDDLRIGDRIDTAQLIVTAAQIDRFADLTGDRFDIHMTDAGAARHGFGGRVAHGLLVLLLIDGLKNQAPAQFRAVASLNWDWAFRSPVLAGDSIGASLTVMEKRETKRAERGILRLEVVVVNPQGTLLQRGTNLLMVMR